MRTLTHSVCLVSVALAVWGCEPASVTDARDQLRRGPARSVQYTIPILRDTLSVADDVLDSLLGVTTIALPPDSLLAVQVNRESVTVAVGASVGAISGILDPALLPQLTFPVEESQEIAVGSLNLGQFGTAMRNATINVALLALSISNSTNAPAVLSNFRLGVVQIDPLTGQPRRVGGQPDYERDAAGNPILVPVADPGLTTFTVPRTSTKIDTLQSAALVDRLVDLLLGGIRSAVVGAGTTIVGDGTFGSVVLTDEVVVRVDAIIGLDLMIPTTGISFDTSKVATGLNLDPADAGETARRIDSASVDLTVINGTPFGLETVVAIVEGSIVGDVFTAPGSVLLDTLAVTAPVVDINGRVTQPTTDTTRTTITSAEALVLFAPNFTAGLRVRLLPPAGGRAAMRFPDRLVIRAAGSVFIRTGGVQ